MSKTFQVKIYSLVELPQNLRLEFKLPQYPFANGPTGPIPPETERLFKQHQIIHYRDEFQAFAICCQPDDGDPTPIQERSGFPAFLSQVILLYNGMTVTRWESDTNPPKYRKLVKKHGDDLAWMVWNRWTLIQEMNEEVVKSG